jgi:molybdopterin synthase sulfur carrier subunit
MRAHIRYFAGVREQLGAGETVSWDETGDASAPRTVGELRAWLAQRSPDHAQALDGGKGLRMAFNQTLCAPDQPLSDGAEVAFFPPVTGG